MQTFEFSEYTGLCFRVEGHYGKNDKWQKISVRDSEGEPVWMLTYYPVPKLKLLEKILKESNVPTNSLFAAKYWSENESLFKFLVENELLCPRHIDKHDILCEFTEKGLACVEKGKNDELT